MKIAKQMSLGIYITGDGTDNRFGAKVYQGTPCRKYGHTERYVSTKKCVICRKREVNINHKKRYEQNREQMLDKNKKWVEENREKRRSTMRKWYRNNKEFFYANNAKRRAAKLNQTPPWADLDKIREIYKNCPEGYDVDHIHPLSKGGLHVDYNLQYLTHHDNRTKHNKIL